MAKAKGKTTKNKKQKKRSNKKTRFFIFSFIFKWSVVIGLWGALFVIAITAWYARELPEITQNAVFERRAAMTILANDGSKITRIGELKGVSVQIADVPDYLRFAIISIEDRRFYSHFGIDPLGVGRAIYTKITKGGRLAGGSTITQQLAKNLFLSHQRSLKRKVQEALLALWLERTLTKDEILSAYLNRVYFGSGNYGVEAAAQSYFGKATTDLNLGESALLAGLLKAPSRYSPTNNLSLAQRRGRLVLNAMVEEGYITKTQAEMQAGLSVTRPKSKPLHADNGRYFADWVVSEAARLIALPEQNVIIETTLDPELQNTAQTSLIKAVKAHGRERDFEQGAVLSLGKDGGIYAMVGGTNYRRSQFNRATQAYRSPGSALKPFIYLVALEEGWDPDDLIDDSVLEGEDYAPENYKEKYYGQVPLYEALSRSLNTAAVRLTQDIGIGDFLRKLRKVGITSHLNRDLSLVLGSSGVSMIELNAAYVSLMNGGKRVQPYGIKRITTEDGVVLYDYSKTKRDLDRVSKSRTVARLNTMLEHVVKYGTGRAAQIDGLTIRGKTGTSQDLRDAWFVGFTDDISTSVWLGNDNNAPMKNVTGGTLPPRIWKDIMVASERDKTPAYLAGDSKHDGMSGLLGRLLGLNE